jgi:hypothetical protein
MFEELELVNKNGEMLAKVTIDTLDLEDPFDQIIHQLKPGMGKAIYLVNNNPQKVISNQTNYKHEKWTQGLEELYKNMTPYKFNLPADADLQEIYVMYGFDSLEENEIQEMYDEAERTGIHVVVRDLRKNNRLVGAKFIYTKDGHLFELHVLTTTKNRIHVPDINRHRIERTSIGNQEGVYLCDSMKQQLLWVDDINGVNIQYEIRTERAAKEWVFTIAESLTEFIL